MTSVSFLSEQPTLQWGWGQLFIAGEQPQAKGHKCPCTKVPSCPPFGPLARQVLAVLTRHVARSKVLSLSSLSSVKPHWQFPDSSTEDRFLSVLKNNVSD